MTQVTKAESMRYYHDEENEVVFEEPDPWCEPHYTKHKSPRYRGCDVGVTVKRVSARNYRKADLTWAEDWAVVLSAQYDERDRPEQAKEMFRALHLGHWGKEIAKKEFERLRAAYEARAQANKAPREAP